MRDAAKRGDYAAFQLGAPSTLNEIEVANIFKLVQKGMGVKEEMNESWFDFDEFRDFVRELEERIVSKETRRKMARVAKRTAKKRARIRKVRAKRRKTGAQLKVKSEKAAKMLLRKKIMGGGAAKWAEMSISQRAMIDARLEKKSKAIKKIAKKLLPKIKKAEMLRVKKARGKTPGQEKVVKEEVQLLREPEIYDRLVQQLKAKGKSEKSAHAIASSQLQKHGVLKKGTRELTPKGKKRNAMSPAERAKDRAGKKDGNNPSEYKYNKKTNIATLNKEAIEMLNESDKKPLMKWFDVFEKELKKLGGAYAKVKPTDALELYYAGTDPKKAAKQLKESLDEVTRPMGVGGKLKVKGKFSKSHIDKLRDAFDKIGKVNPSSQSYKNLVNYLDSLPTEQLKQLADAKPQIKFISNLARNRVKKVKESVELDEKHLLGKTVLVAGRKGTVTKFLGDDFGREMYKVKLEDGSTIEASSTEMESVSESASKSLKPSSKSEKKKVKGHQHDCAIKVEHADFGRGTCVKTQHAEPDEKGNVAWYDVLFEHGIERKVPIEDLNVLLSEYHSH